MRFILLLAIVLTLSQAESAAQNGQEQFMEQMLDRVDQSMGSSPMNSAPGYASPGSMSPPYGGGSPSPYTQNPSAFGLPPGPGPSYPGQMQQNPFGQQAAPYMQGSPYGQGGFSGGAIPGQSAPFGGYTQYPSPQVGESRNPFFSGANRAAAAQPAAGGPFGLTPRDVLRYLIGGGDSGGSGGSKTDPRAVGNAQSNLQTALDQASRAENAASRANSGTDKNARRAAASDAEYAASAARGAADRATSAAYNGSQLARDYAAQARDAASRARGAADRARYNAETYNPPNRN